MKNSYKIKGEVTIIYAKCSRGRIHNVLIDTEDLELVKWGHNWTVQYTSNAPYVTGSVYGNAVGIHRLVMRALTMFDKEIDHIHHKTLDNRKSQLRIVTKAENQQNRQLSKNNVSGYTGVFYNPENKKWASRITANKKVFCLGSYENKEEAIQARKEGEKKYHTYKQSIKNA